MEVDYDNSTIQILNVLIKIKNYKSRIHESQFKDSQDSRLYQMELEWVLALLPLNYNTLNPKFDTI